MPSQITYEIIPDNSLLKTILAPTHLLRSSVFGVVTKGRRNFVEDKVITTLDRSVIKYSGPELSEYDCDIWLTILNLAVKNELFERGRACCLKIGTKTILKSMGKTTGMNARHATEKSIRRLVSATFTISSDKQRYTGSFIPEVFCDDYTKKTMITINSYIAELFMSNTTWIDFQIRLKLRCDLSKWLHGYMITHTSGGVIHRISLSKIMNCSRSNHINEYKFKARLKRSISEILKEDESLDIKLTTNNVVEYSRIKRRDIVKIQDSLC